MKKVSVYLCAALLSGLGACQSPEPDMTLNVDLASHEADFPSTMYGIFFEEINHAGDGGLYAEMLMNRSFEERVLPEGYRVENGELVAPSVMNHMAGLHRAVIVGAPTLVRAGSSPDRDRLRPTCGW